MAAVLETLAGWCDSIALFLRIRRHRWFCGPVFSWRKVTGWSSPRCETCQIPRSTVDRLWRHHAES